MALGTLGRSAADVLVRIKADTQSYDAALKKTERTTDTFSKNIAKMGPAIAASFGIAAAGLVAYSVKAAVNYQVLEKGFHSLVTAQGKDVDQSLANLKRASHGTMAEAKIFASANKALLLGIDIETITQMMEGSAVIAQATGQDVDMMFESLAMGVGRQSRMLLDNLGIIVKVEDANQKYADSLGVTIAQLTEDEKKTAFLTAAMDGMNERVEILGGFDSTTAQANVAKLHAVLGDLSTELGMELLPLLTDGLMKINEWGESGGWEQTTTGLGYIAQGMENVAISAGYMARGSAELMDWVVRKNNPFMEMAYQAEQISIENDKSLETMRALIGTAHTVVSAGELRLDTELQTTDELIAQNAELDKQLQKYSALERAYMSAQGGSGFISGSGSAARFGPDTSKTYADQAAVSAARASGEITSGTVYRVSIGTVNESSAGSVAKAINKEISKSVALH